MSDRDAAGLVPPENLAWTLDQLGAEGAAWFGSLPSRIVESAERWSLEVGPPFMPGGYSSYVLAVTCDDGTPAVLKLAFPGEGPDLQLAALRAWDGIGAVRVLRAEPRAYLLERCSPGDSLADRGLSEENLRGACEVLSRLWRSPGAVPWTWLSDCTRAWAAGLTDRNRSHGAPLGSRVVECVAEFAESIECVDGVLLHGELRPPNLLAAEREPWLAIDPEPMNGEPASDLARVVVFVPDEASTSPSPEVLRRRVDVVSEHLSLDRSRVALWALAEGVRELLGAFHAGCRWSDVRVQRARALASVADVSW